MSHFIYAIVFDTKPVQKITEYFELLGLSDVQLAAVRTFRVTRCFRTVDISFSCRVILM